MSTLLNICSHCHGAAFKISSMYNISQDLADYSIIIYKPFAFVIFISVGQMYIKPDFV